MSFIERLFLLCPLFRGSTIRGFTVHVLEKILLFRLFIWLYFIGDSSICESPLGRKGRQRGVSLA